MLAVPSQNIRAVITRAKKHIDPSAIIINIAKGIENETLKIMSEVILEVNDSISNYVSLSGPSHAEEVVSNMPTAVVAASKNIETDDEESKEAPTYKGIWNDNSSLPEQIESDQE